MNQQDNQDTAADPELLHPMFAADLGCISSHRQLIKAIREHPRVTQEVQRTRREHRDQRNPHETDQRERNLQALRDLAQRKTDSRYTHPWDFSITALLLIITQTDPQRTQEAAEIAANIPRAHTASRLAQSILKDAMSPRASSPKLQRHLRALIQQVNTINQPDNHTGAANLETYNNQVRETILTTWRETALMLGHNQTVREAGYDTPTSGAAAPTRRPRNIPAHGNQKATGEALASILGALDNINHPERQGQPLNARRETLRTILDAVDAPKRDGEPQEDTPEPSSADTHRHNNAMKAIMQQAWEDLTHATGNHTLAVTLSQEQPILPLSHTPDPYRALGVAAYHAAAAAGTYTRILDSPEPDGPRTQQQLQQLHQTAERDARLAHRALYLLHNETAFHDPMVMEIRKRTQELHAWLTRARAESAVRLGISPLPNSNRDLQHHDIDHRNPGPQADTKRQAET